MLTLARSRGDQVEMNGFWWLEPKNLNAINFSVSASKLGAITVWPDIKG